MNFKDKILEIAKKKNVKIGIGIFLLICLVWYTLRPQSIIVESVIIEKGTFEQIIQEEGITRVIDRYSVFAPVDGILRRVEKNPGESVTKGEVVAQLDWDVLRQVKSPISGTILNVHRESAGPIAMGTPILDIGDTRKMEIVANILTSEVAKLKPGNTVEIQGWSDQVIIGKLRLIEPAAFTKLSSLGVEEQRVRAIIDFTPPQGMGEGFQVLCKIIAFRKDDKVLVPTSALFRDGDNWSVFTVVKKRARKVTVSLEEKAGGYAIAAEGLQPGDRVIVYPGEWVRDSIKVKLE
ncbi:efflux RND transporter periplasmic adaptor subunit [Leptospira sp. GIMC2001]|uniref:efflux RND transporter periplasmic adaptor subunit n=1 Tax=Leptospira sp. GIMC2001 TaxID=1513297 RepID=UPI00234ADE96|nr:HlyD family efflux transporter periplasmic adaptor subunit [Leptospira sp. GIMC2001]WCL49709.1 HlyD family efflux transporter periplasmic adaptor subunit [Leptospira sp. GIMC2001]